MKCLDEDMALTFVHGELSAEAATAVEVHLDACEECLALIVELAKTEALESTETPHGEPETHAAAGDATGGAPLRRGEAVGRYVVLEFIAAGGMGVVYAAYDPQLDRKIALKLLRTSAATNEDRGDRMLREARAMARVSHPNILTVHDVGTAAGRIFLALEFVEGTTLTGWKNEAARTTEEILERFVAAGRGLAAAHHAGLVHRDFKPENVLISRDGRVLVADFGLALYGPTERSAARASTPELAKDITHVALTATGALLGTPAYMSPEQCRGEVADARADQFSFCVALYEAVYGEHPFRAATVDAFLDNVREARVGEPPRGSHVAPALRRTLLRGLRAAPAERHPSMDALLAKLTRETKRRRGLVLGAALALLFVSSAAFAVVRSNRAPELLCKGAERKLEGVWDAPRKRAVQDAFIATHVPFAVDAWQRTERALDTYVRDWARMHVDACEATHLRGEQSAELLDYRVACLGDRQKELRALVDVLAGADADVVKNAVVAAQSLGRLDRCTAAAALEERTRKAPTDPRVAPQVAEIRTDLARAKELRDAGKYAAASAVAVQAVVAADRIGDGPVRAEALFRRGELEGLTGDLKGAEDTLLESSRVAEGARDDRTRARALAELVYIGSMNRPDLMPFFRDESAAAIARLGGDPEIEAFRASNLVVVLRARGELEVARIEAEHAVALAAKLDGPESRLVGIGIHNLAGVLLAKGEYARALETFERALAITEATLGPTHPNVARTLSEICETFYLERKYTLALGRCERAVRLGEEVLPKDHVSLSDAYDNFGAVLVALGDYQKALTLGQKSLAIREAHFGASHRKLLYPLTLIGKAYVGLGKRAEAIEALERGLAAGGASAPADDRADAEFALARAFVVGRGTSRDGGARADAGDALRGRKLAESALAAYASLGAVHEEDRREVEAWLRDHPAR